MVNVPVAFTSIVRPIHKPKLVTCTAECDTGGSSSEKKFLDKAIENSPNGNIGPIVMAPLREGVEEGYGSKTPKTGK